MLNNFVKFFTRHSGLNYGRDIIRGFLEKFDYHSVLDLGAGQGHDLMMAKKINPRAELYALEIYKAYIEKLQDKKIKVNSINLEKDKYPYEDGSIDVVIANQIIEHTKEIFWIFNEVERVLRVGGYFIVGVPNLASLYSRVLLSLGRQPTSIQVSSAHVRGYTKENLKKFAQIGDFKLIDYKGSNFYPFPPLIAKAMSWAFPSLSVCNFYLFKKVRENNNEFIKYPLEKKLETNFYLGDD